MKSAATRSLQPHRDEEPEGRCTISAFEQRRNGAVVHHHNANANRVPRQPKQVPLLHKIGMLIKVDKPKSEARLPLVGAVWLID